MVAGYQRYGSSLAAHMDELGLVNERFTVAHGVWLDDEDMKRLGDRGASVAHNPGSNMRLGNGLADVRGMLSRKVNVGVGTDGASCSDNQNMYEAMRLASFASKVQGPDVQRWLTTDEVLRAATEGSARALGLQKQIGRIAPGYKADIVFLDLHHINWIPTNDPVNALVHTEDGTSVHSVMIGGRMIVENHKLLTVDLAALAAKAEESRTAAGEDHRARQEALRAAGEGRRHVLSRVGQGAAAHPPLRREPPRSLSEQHRYCSFQLGHVGHDGIGHLRFAARPLAAMPTGTQQDCRHAQRLGGRDVVVDAVAHHDAVGRRHAQRLGGRQKGARVGLPEATEPAQALIVEKIADPGARQALARRLGLVGDDAEAQPKSVQAAQQAVDLGPELEDVEVADHGAHPVADALDRLRIAAAQCLDHVGIGIGREGFDRRLRRLLDHGLVDANAFQPTGRGDGAVDGDFPGEFQIERTTDVEEDCAIRHLPSPLQRLAVVGERIG